MIVAEDDVIIRRMMERSAARRPDDEVVTLEDGVRWTSRDALDQAGAAADALRKRGVGPGTVVALLLPNGPDYLRAWWGAHFLGAVLMPFNPGWKGNLLRHFINLSKPALCITIDAMSADVRSDAPDLLLIDAAELATGDPSFRPDVPMAIGDTHHLGATSGTTGPSKLWRISHLQFAQVATYIQLAGLGGRDRFLLDLPLFHQHAMGNMRSCQLSGVPVTLRAKPSMSRFFEVIRETGATATTLVGSMAAKLSAEAPSPRDRDHGLKLIMAAPLPQNLRPFCERFGIERVITSMGSTEVGGPLMSDPDGLPPEGSCGKAREGWDLRVVDENDADVADGVVGELLVRPGHPALLSGYVDNPEATAEAWRGGWYHSGDLVRRDAEGHYYFVDRLKDSIRRRGENISSYEVEAEIRAHPAVKDVACVAALSDADGGQEVKVWIVTEPGMTLDFAELAAFTGGRMAKFMVPRFYELIDALPMTVTGRVQKHLLRARGNSPDTWDIEAGRSTRAAA